jgi:hypothetical protein
VTKLVPWDEQADAERIVTRVLGGSVDPGSRDPGGGSQQRHDFDVILSNGRVIAVEVTQHTSKKYLDMLGAIDRCDWDFSQLHYDWNVSIVGTLNVREVEKRIAGPLARLESRDLESLVWRQPTDLAAQLTAEELDAVEELHKLGVRIAFRSSSRSGAGGHVHVGEAARAGSIGPEAVVAAVEDCAADTGNEQKLSNATYADERHLFVWMTNPTAAYDAMTVGGLPDTAPVLPPSVDAVWAARAAGRFRTWLYRRDEEWRDLDLMGP